MRAGAAANIVFAAAKVVPLVLVAVIGGRYVHVENVRVANFPDWSSVGTSLVLVVFAYSGIETALAPSGEITNSERVIPKAALAGVGVVVLLYVGLQFVAQGILGPALRGHEAPLAAVGGMLLPGGRGLLIFTACVSLIGCIQGDLLGTSRLLYAVARDGFLPRQLAVVNARHRVPVRAVAAHACTACVLAIAGSFTTLALVSGGAFCFVYIACCASAWKLQRNGESDTGSPLILPGGPTIPALAVIGLLLLLASLSSAEWTAIGLAAVASCGLYGLRAHRLHRSA